MGQVIDFVSYKKERMGSNRAVRTTVELVPPYIHISAYLDDGCLKEHRRVLSEYLLRRWMEEMESEETPD